MTDPKSPDRPSFEDVVAMLQHKLIGASEVFLTALWQLYQAAGEGTLVRIEGETGVGKEACARFFHYSTGRPGELVTVNCPAIAESMTEAELFGHTRGAFTGAQSKRIGLIARAEKGTIVFDEIHTLSTGLQEKLLRMLQEKTIRPVGSDTDQEVDVQIVVATNKNLKEAVAGGSMRQDFFYRIQGLRIEVPPLRARGGDVILLANHFLRERFGEDHPVMSPRAESFIRAYDWPGNVRELQNTIASFALRRTRQNRTGNVIEVEDLEQLLEVDSRQLPMTLGDLLLVTLTRHGKLSVPQMCALLEHSNSRIYEILKGFRAAGLVCVDQRKLYRVADNLVGLEFPQMRALLPPAPAHEVRSDGRLQGAGLERIALRLAKDGVSRAKLIAATGVPKRTASRCLTRLRNEGKLRQVGEHPRHHYELPEKGQEATPAARATPPDRPAEQLSCPDAPGRTSLRRPPRISQSSPAAMQPDGSNNDMAAASAPVASPEHSHGEVARGVSSSPVPDTPSESAALPVSPAAIDQFAEADDTAEDPLGNPEETWPSLNTLADARRVVEIIRRRLRPDAEAEILRILRDRGPMTLNELFPVVGESRSSTHRLLIRLSDRRDVTREVNGNGGFYWRVAENLLAVPDPGTSVAPASCYRNSEERLIAALMTRGISTGAVTQAFGSNETKSYRTLTELVSEGELKPVGAGCRTRYILPDNSLAEGPSDESEPP